MNSLARKFYEKGSEYQEVLFLSEEKGIEWQEISEKSPDLPRGWFELSRLNPEDRLEFIRDFWFDILPFQPNTHARLRGFFDRLEDISVVLAKQEDGYQAEMVYSLSDNSSFFRGLSPAVDEDLRELRVSIGIPLPRDYLSFQKLHNGFGKLSDLGLLRIEDVEEARRRVKDLLLKGNHPIKSGGRMVDPSSLIPFFEAFGLGSFQCFFADWYPSSEMGNVYLSGIDYTISDTTDRKGLGECLAFPTFLEWLAHYVEGMNVSP